MAYPGRLTRDNAVLLIVDHQVGLYSGVRDIEILNLKHNVVGCNSPQGSHHTDLDNREFVGADDTGASRSAAGYRVH